MRDASVLCVNKRIYELFELVMREYTDLCVFRTFMHDS